MPRTTTTSIARLLSLTTACILLLSNAPPVSSFALPQPPGLPTEALAAAGTSNWGGFTQRSVAGDDKPGHGGESPRPLSSFEDSIGDDTKTNDDAPTKKKHSGKDSGEGEDLKPKPKKSGADADAGLGLGSGTGNSASGRKSSFTGPASAANTPAFVYNPPKKGPSTGMGSSSSDGLGSSSGPDDLDSKPAKGSGSPSPSKGDSASPAPAAAPQTAQALLKNAQANIRTPKGVKKAAYALAFHGSASCGGTLLGVALNDEPTPKDGCATVVKADGVTVAKARSASVWTKGNGYKVQWYAEAGCKKPITTSPESSEGDFSRTGGTCESPSASGGFSYYKVVKS